MSSDKNKNIFSIGEVGRLTGLEPHVLRYWETEFKELKPRKNRAGRRIYNDNDIEIVKKLKDLLYTKKFTIDGAKIFLKEERLRTNQVELPLETNDFRNVISHLKSEIKEILTMLE
ncbi:MAG: MerR family transcriptional regulator [FCB group bacterium]|nr:MerR family transcriptional regulator [FCB group bacterium]